MGENPFVDITNQPSSQPKIAAKSQKASKKMKNMDQRRTSDNDSSLFTNEYLLHQRQNAHNFYGTPNLDARGRGVGSRTPVKPPVECPENDPIPQKKEVVSDPRRESKIESHREENMSMSNQSRYKKKDSLAGTNRSSKGDLRKNSATNDNFLVITKSPSPPEPQSRIAHVHKRIQKIYFGS